MAKFLFEQTNFSVDPNQCFMVMPFDSKLNNVYDLINSVVEDKCGLNCIRADELPGSNRITSDIWRLINESRFIIADLTDRNPNVFYEIGIAHALKKRVVFITQNPSFEVPFDVRDIRYIQYDLTNLRKLTNELPVYIKEALTTIPAKWDRNFCPPNWSGPYVKITSVDAPTTVSEGQPFDITLIAKNNGADAMQGYFSVSFPSMVESAEIVESNTSIQTGKRGGQWGGGRVILKYPIAEGFRYSDDAPCWDSGKEYFIKVRAHSSKRGLLRFFVSASSRGLNGEWKSDPFDKNGFDIDQRDEPVYSGVINVDR